MLLRGSKLGLMRPLRYKYVFDVTPRLFRICPLRMHRGFDSSGVGLSPRYTQVCSARCSPTLCEHFFDLVGLSAFSR